jgi:anti-sigma factor RsiW
MPEKHVRQELSAYCDGEVPEERIPRIEAHLAKCADCRRELGAIRSGAGIAKQLERIPAPDSLWGRVEARLENPGRAPVRLVTMPRMAYAGAGLLLLAVLAFALTLYQTRQILEIEKVSSPLADFERAALEAHVRRLAGASGFDFATDSPRQAREWIRRHAGLDMNLAVARPAEDAGRFRVKGAGLVRAAEAQAGVVAYEIDAHPVTLLTAHLEDLRNAPPDLQFKKKVAYRLEAGGRKMFTWGSGGQAYVLVSDLPGRGTDACSICHTVPERRELIRQAPFKGRP